MPEVLADPGPKSPINGRWCHIWQGWPGPETSKIAVFALVWL
jgi:hypothetical protein